MGKNDPEARFRGPLTYDFGVTNVKWEAATPEYSYVTFDLHWSYSWRAKWTEPAKASVTGRDIEVLLKTLKEHRGTTLMVVTHKESLSREMDRRVGLVGGKLVELQ